MSDKEDQIQNLQAQKADLKEALKLRDAILRLIQNDDFKTVIDKAYMEDEALRAARCIGDPALDQKMQQDMVYMAGAPGHLRRFLSKSIRMADVAESSIISIDQSIEDIRLEIAEDNE